ncbi:unnamed protein product [Peniophora sp. CBMAI 1063]|nr:unnamed protein product [Peniophora sp. CBMAI 1063]
MLSSYFQDDSLADRQAGTARRMVLDDTHRSLYPHPVNGDDPTPPEAFLDQTPSRSPRVITQDALGSDLEKALVGGGKESILWTLQSKTKSRLADRPAKGEALQAAFHLARESFSVGARSAPVFARETVHDSAG